MLFKERVVRYLP